MSPDLAKSVIKRVGDFAKSQNTNEQPSIAELIETIQRSRQRVRLVLNFDEHGEIHPEVELHCKNAAVLKLFRG